jgi:formylglycine-generating enzyme required for sulfatase activity
MALRRLYGGPSEDPEFVPDVKPYVGTPMESKTKAKSDPVAIDGWPFPVEVNPIPEMTIELPDNLEIKMVRVPAGRFVMGNAGGRPDEFPVTVVHIEKPFWISVNEVTNEQYRQFNPLHDSRYYGKRHSRSDDRGLSLNGNNQPVVRISWRDAVAFCEWLSSRSGLQILLPTEAQWEYACRAGSDTELYYGETQVDFTIWANMADRSFATGWWKNGIQVTSGVEHLVLEGAALSDTLRDDRFCVTAPVGQFRPNGWGLYDMHGNVAEWTRTSYASYPYTEYNNLNGNVLEEKVVRGGSFFDRPERCGSAVRLSFPAWQRVFNVGFRVVWEENRVASMK